MNCFKSCFSRQQPNSSNINRNAFIPVTLNDNFSDVTISSQNQKKDIESIAHKQVRQQQKIALIKKYQEQREKGNQFESATALKKEMDKLKS